jgi:multiple sugar transport system ATP-binding protein
MTLGADAGGIPAEVDLVEATGIGMILHMKAGGQLLKIYTTDRVKFRSGDRLAMHIDPLDLLLFDVDSGKRLRPLSQGAAPA